MLDARNFLHEGSFDISPIKRRADKIFLVVNQCVQLGLRIHAKNFRQQAFGTAVDIQPFMDWHKDWRYDMTHKIRAALALFDDRLPLFEIDGHFYSYPEAMLAIKNIKKTEEVNRP